MVPALVWPWVFTLGYVLVAPLGCTRFATPTIADGVGSLEGSTRCNALFFTNAGDGSYSPPIWPAVLVGAAFATGIVVLVRRTMTRRGLGLRAPDTPPDPPTPFRDLGCVRRRDVLGGLVHEYELAA